MRINSVNVSPTTIQPSTPSTQSSEGRVADRPVYEATKSSGSTERAAPTGIPSLEATMDVEKTKVDPEKNKEIMDKSIEQANTALRVYDRKIERTVHDVTKTVMYVIKDTKTNEVIAEYPPKKIQDMIAKMWELAGLFVDKKA